MSKLTRYRHKIYFNQPTLPFEEWEDETEIIPDIPRLGHPEYTDLDVGEDDAPRRPPLYFISLGSGSSGNSCYIGTAEAGILVDAGIKSEDVARMLADNGIPMSRVKALLLTHDHSDHVKYSYNILRNNRHIALYCTNRVLNGLLRRHNISRRIKDFHRPIFKEIPFSAAGFDITAFEVPHDGTDNMGFSIEFDGRRFVLATDLGCVSDRARHYMGGANYLVIESNYDSDMLARGPYPEYLKARIRAGQGHLDNRDTAAFLQEIANPALRYVFLCHLSQDNNTPQKALSTVRTALEEKGLKVGSAQETLLDRKADIQLMALPRFDPSRCFVFRK